MVDKWGMENLVRIQHMRVAWNFWTQKSGKWNGKMKSIWDYPPCVLHNHNAKGDGDFANDANDFLRTEKQMSTDVASSIQNKEMKIKKKKKNRQEN
jgi:hypothetical protein